MPWHIRQHRSSIVALWLLPTMAMFINPNMHFGPANESETFVTPLLCNSLYFLWSVFPRRSHSWSLATAIEWQRHSITCTHTYRRTNAERQPCRDPTDKSFVPKKVWHIVSGLSLPTLRVKRRVNSIMLEIFRPTPDRHDWKGQYIGRTLN